MVGQPEISGRTAVVLTLGPKKSLEVAGVSLDGGRVLWRAEEQPQVMASGISISPLVTKSHAGRRFVVVQRIEQHENFDYSWVAALDADTGKEIKRTQEINGNEPLEACDDGYDVCGVGWANGSANLPFRWSLDTGKISTLRNAVPDSREMTNGGLYATGERPGEELFRMSADRRMWKRPVAQLFGRGATSDEGWSFDLHPSEGVFFGGLGLSFPKAIVKAYDAGKPVSYSLRDHFETVGIDAKTGAKLWRVEGADPWCPGLDDDRIQGVPTAVCMIVGTRHEQQHKKQTTTGFGVELRGLDPRTGKTTWSYAASPGFAKTLFEDGVTVLGPNGLVIVTADGALSVDAVTGATQPVADTAMLLCAGDSESVDSRATGDHTLGRLYYSCTPDGRRSSKPISEWALSALPAHGNWRVVAFNGELRGYRTS